MVFHNIHQRQFFIPLILFLLAAIFFYKVIIHPNQMIYSPVSDVISGFSYFKFFISQTFARFGELPLWTPYIYAGSPFVSDMQSTMFYPLDIFYLLFPSDLIFGYMFLLDIFLAGIFMYALARVLELNKTSSFIAAIIFMFNTWTITHVYAGHILGLNAVTWTPLIFLFIELGIRKEKLFYGVLAGVPLAFQFLTGHFQYVLYSFSGLFIYFLVRSFYFVKEKKTSKAITFAYIFVLMTVVGLVLSAIQILPSYELSGYFTRTGGMSYGEATWYSLEPEQIISFFVPELFGNPEISWGYTNFWEISAYIGVLPLMLAFIAILFKRNKFTVAFLILSVFSVLFALGNYIPVFSIFYNFVPGFNMFRIPSKMLFLYVFSMSILSGFGMQSLSEKISTKQSKKFLKYIGLTLIFSFLFSGFILFSNNFIKDDVKNFITNKLSLKIQEYELSNEPIPLKINFILQNFDLVYNFFVSKFIIFLLLLISSLSVIFYGAKYNNIKYFKLLVIVLILFDLWFIGLKYIDTKIPNEIFIKQDFIGIFESDGNLFRVYDTNGLIPQRIAVRDNIQLIGGYNPIKLNYYQDFLDNLGDKAMDYLNVKYIVTNSPIYNKNSVLIYYNDTAFDYKTMRYEKKDVYVYKNKEFLPRSFLVHKIKVIQEKENIFKELKKNDFNPKETIILEKEPNIQLYDTNKQDDIEIKYYSPNKIILKANSTSNGFLILNEIWYPDWKAFIDGKETEIYKADYIFRAVYLDSGPHEIEFVYYPDSLKIGAIITLLVLIVIFYTLLKHGRNE